MQKFVLSKVKHLQDLERVFDHSCTVEMADKTLNALESKRLRLSVAQMGRKERISNLNVVLQATSGHINLSVGGNDNYVEFGSDTKGRYDVRLWRNSQVLVGDETTSNGIEIICDNSSFETGQDCMFSSDILIQTCDQHGIVELATGKIVNNVNSQVTIGNHVWLCRQSTIMPNVSVGEGSIVGACALVTRSVPKMTVVAGVPAKAIRKDSTWCRNPTRLDAYAKKYVSDFSSSRSE